MVIKSISLADFRNYENISLEPEEGLNILYGDNAQGKTNFLEAIFVAGTTRSHRGSKDREMIRLGSENAHIRVEIEKNSNRRRIDMELRLNRAKGAAIDGISVKKSSDIFGLMHLIFFSPEDLDIIKDGPSERRRFIDTELSQVDKIYLYNLSKYNKVIRQRNDLLKQLDYNASLADTLSVWDEQLINYGVEIYRARKRFVDELNEIVKPIHERLSGGKEELVIKYLPDVTDENFADVTNKEHRGDIFQKTTRHGPHRDDLVFYINENDAKRFGSQGQQRTAALSVKLSEIELTKSLTGDTPALLLDDVLSELDRNRQELLLSGIGDVQTFITCTGLEEYIEKRRTSCSVFRVSGGKIDKES